MKKFLYAKGKEPIIVDECQEMDGWHDSPLAFVKTTDFGVDPDDAMKVQLLGEAIEGVKDCANGMLNLHVMSMKQLREFAETNFPEIKARSKKAIIRKIENTNGNSSRYH